MTTTLTQDGEIAADLRGVAGAGIQAGLADLVHADLFPPDAEVSQRLERDPIFAALYRDENRMAEYRTNGLGERVTCPVHVTWLYRCVNGLPHAASRWCVQCAQPMQVAVDELTCTITVSCACFDGDVPTSLAHVLRAACYRSIRAAMHHRHGVNAGHPAGR